MLLPVPLSPLSVQSRLLDAPHNERLPSTAWFSRSRRMSRLHFSALYCVLLRSIAEVFESKSLKSAASALLCTKHPGWGVRPGSNQPTSRGGASPLPGRSVLAKNLRGATSPASPSLATPCAPSESLLPGTCDSLSNSAPSPARRLGGYFVNRAIIAIAAVVLLASTYVLTRGTHSTSADRSASAAGDATPANPVNSPASNAATSTNSASNSSASAAPQPPATPNLPGTPLPPLRRLCPLRRSVQESRTSTPKKLLAPKPRPSSWKFLATISVRPAKFYTPRPIAC